MTARCQPGAETKSSGAPAPWYKGLSNLLPVGISSSLCGSEYIYINEVNRKMQILALELANGHVKDDENKSRPDFFVACLMLFIILKKDLALLKVQLLLPTLSIFLTRFNCLFSPCFGLISYIGF